VPIACAVSTGASPGAAIAAGRLVSAAVAAAKKVDRNDSATTVQTQNATSLRFRNIKAYKFGDFDGDHRSDILWIDEDHQLYMNYATSTAAGIDFSNSTYVGSMPGTVNYGALWEVGWLKNVGHLLQTRVAVEGIRTGAEAIAVNWIEAIQPIGRALGSANM